jgi:hypothetical protein
MKWLNGWSAAATFEGQFSNFTNSYAGKGVVRYACDPAIAFSSEVATVHVKKTRHTKNPAYRF